MQTIWKFPLILGDLTHSMPRGATVLHAQLQRDEPVMWALVDPSQPQEQRAFSVYGTGQELPDDPGEYIATFQMHGGALVFHVFERKRTA